ncbi:MAG: dephospho-CoA kinase [Actinomycetota bacterium]|nr:dephospho-CoA kinase [Actinomycetota bacterium]
MLTVGLTGGIGAGKSAVSALLVARGAWLIDADVLAREVLAPGTPGQEAVLATFGSSFLLPDGGLDRPGLGRRVFADPDELERLNAIVHPLVADRMEQALSSARASGALVVVHDVPLLAENGLADNYDVVVVVDAAAETQLFRLVHLRGMSEPAARDRMSRQASRQQRLAVADEVLHNDGTLAELAAQVEALWTRLLDRASGDAG